LTISNLPTAVDGSAGRDKSDVRPVPNLETYVPAAEWNTVKNGVVTLAAELGLSDGSTAGSVNASLVRSGLRDGRWSVEDDFVLGDAAARYFTQANGSGSTSTFDKASGAAGAAVMSAAAVSSGRGSVFGRYLTVTGEMNPTFEARFKVTMATGAKVQIGLADQVSPNSYVLAEFTDTNELVAKAARSGGSSQSLSTGTNISSAWQTVKIVIVGGTSAAFYLNGTYVASLTTGAAIVTGSALGLTPFANIERTSAGPHVLSVDWWRVYGARP
jgi:hypothetical protein